VEAYNAAAPPGLVSPGGAATVGKRLPDGESHFAIPVFVHPSNEFAMLLVEHPIPKNAPRRLGGALRTTGVTAPGRAITRLTRRWRAARHKRRRLTDKPSTMPRPNHAATTQVGTDESGVHPCSSGTYLACDEVRAGDASVQGCRSHAAFR